MAGDVATQKGVPIAPSRSVYLEWRNLVLYQMPHISVVGNRHKDIRPFSWTMEILNDLIEPSFYASGLHSSGSQVRRYNCCLRAAHVVDTKQRRPIQVGHLHIITVNKGPFGQAAYNRQQPSDRATDGPTPNHESRSEI